MTPTPSPADELRQGYRERIYAHYVSSAAAPLAPAGTSGFAPRAPYLRRVIRRHFPPDRGAAVLDLGCGHGALLHFAREAGYQNVRGVDVSGEQVQAARRLGMADVEQGDLIDTLRRAPGGSLDAVVAFDVIEHFTRDELMPFADEVLRVLRPGGRWIIHTPNGASPFGGQIRYGDLTHEQAFTSGSLTQLLSTCGFRSVSFFEDTPVVHGVKSAARAAAWLMIRQVLRFYLAAETGVASPPVLTQNLLAVAYR